MLLRARTLAFLTIPLAFGCGDSGGGPTTTGSSGDTTVTSGTPPTSSPTEASSAAETTDPGGSSAVTGSETGTTVGTSEATTGTSDTTGPGSTGPVTATSTGSTGMESTGSSSTGEPPCPEDTILCTGKTAQVCDGVGGFKSEELCPSECVMGKGCVLCVPGASSCEGDKVLLCNDEGSALDPVETCDGLQGLSCDPNAGACVGACAGLGLSYIGCDYYPTVLQQHDGYNSAPTHEYAVAVANTSDQVATVTVTRGGNNVAVAMVAANSVQLIKLPWVNELTKGQGPSLVLADGAYRLRSTRPVTVYQYNPLNATTTNDASLLLPVNTWSGNYLVAAWPVWVGYPGFYTVVAHQDNTTVTLKPSGTGKQIKAGGGVAADGSGKVVLGEGDVLSVIASGGDPTGTIIDADKPVQVFGGHECTNVPLNVSACDHLEESMFPIETLAKEYVVVPPVQVPNDQLAKAQVVRVVASEDNTTLVFTPDQPVGKLLAKAGDYVEISSNTAKFLVAADKKIMVAQYMVGQSGGFGTSDPAMLLAVNPLQWRKSYLFFAATTWKANYVDILGPLNAAVTVDGVAVGGWQAIGASNYQVAHVKLSNAGNGTHSVISDVGVGIAVYGVQDYGSYWYPGGLDLDVIPQ
jgi:hypothetical protein